MAEYRTSVVVGGTQVDSERLYHALCQSHIHSTVLSIKVETLVLAANQLLLSVESANVLARDDSAVLCLREAINSVLESEKRYG